MAELSDLEKSLIPKLTPQHEALFAELTGPERNSLKKYVDPGNIDLIQSWIGSDEEIEQMLFWDQGGKYDDANWQALKPVGEADAALMQAARDHFAAKRVEAVESQRRSDLTLYSQFNHGLLYTGLAGALRCNADGVADEAGGYFKGVEWRLIGSVEDQVNSLTIWPGADGGYEVHLGGRANDADQGIWIYTGDSHSLLQLAQVAIKVLPKNGFDTQVQDEAGNTVELDPKYLRRMAMENPEALDYPKELKLLAKKQCDGLEDALAAGDVLAFRLYERFGLEIEAYKIGKKYGNFYIMREENFDFWLPTEAADRKALVLLTATLVCRRCRRELKDFRDAARDFPGADFVLVNLSSPQFKFYDRVFGDMGGGDPDEFRKNAAGVTPFIIIYSANGDKVLEYREYIATDKAESSPELHKEMPRIMKEYFA